jgi:hypothetical protein
MTDYVVIGLIILLFIFELLLLWQSYYNYTNLNNSIIDCQDMLTDIYTLDIIAAKSSGLEIIAKIPKRVQERLDKHKKTA